MPTSLGIAAFEFKRPFAEAFSLTSDLGVRHCELTTPDDITMDNVGQVAEAAARHGIAVTAVASLTKPNATEDLAATLAVLDESIEIAAALGAANVITYFGGHPTRSLDEAVERYVKAIGSTVELAGERGVGVLVENHFSHAPGEVTNTARGCRDLVEAVGSDVFAVNFDHCNFAIGGQDLTEAYDLLKPYIRNVHVKDARPYDPVADRAYDGRIVTDLVHGEFIFVPVEEGITDNDTILDLVVGDGLDVPVTVEAHVPERLLADTFARGLTYCRRKGV